MPHLHLNKRKGARWVGVDYSRPNRDKHMLTSIIILLSDHIRIIRWWNEIWYVCADTRLQQRRISGTALLPQNESFYPVFYSKQVTWKLGFIWAHLPVCYFMSEAIHQSRDMTFVFVRAFTLNRLRQKENCISFPPPSPGKNNLSNSLRSERTLNGLMNLPQINLKPSEDP